MKRIIVYLSIFIFICSISTNLYAPPIGIVVPQPWDRWNIDVDIVYNWGSNAGEETSGLSFVGPDEGEGYLPISVDDAYDGWRLADQRVVIHINPPSRAGGPNDGTIGYVWGLRIITDNTVDLGVTEGNELEDGSLSYGGLINTSHVDDPIYRGQLAWQVYIEALNESDLIYPTDESFDGNDGWAGEIWESVTGVKDYGDWNADWAYLGDKFDTGYNELIDTNEDGVLDDADTIYGDTVVFRMGSDYEINYYLTAYGTGEGTNIAYHPADKDEDGDTDADDISLYDVDGDGETMDLVVYIAAKFIGNVYIEASDSSFSWPWSSADPIEFLLPAGEYRTTIYIELFTE